MASKLPAGITLPISVIDPTMSGSLSGLMSSRTSVQAESWKAGWRRRGFREPDPAFRTLLSSLDLFNFTIPWLSGGLLEVSSQKLRWFRAVDAVWRKCELERSPFLILGQN